MTRTETWTVRGPIDAECGKCHAVGCELVITLPVKGRVVADDPPVSELSFNMEFQLTADAHVAMRCMSCGNTVRYGELETTVDA